MDKLNALVACGSDASLKKRLVPHIFDQRKVAYTFCANGKFALRTFLGSRWDLCVICENLPLLPGFQLTRKIRRENEVVPLIFLKENGASEPAYRAGADIVLPKNFNDEIFHYRAAALLKRSSTTQPMRILQFGDYIFNPATASLASTDTILQVTFTRRQADILRMLLDHPGQTIRRAEILQKVWQKDSYFKGRSMDVLVAKLRQKLAPVRGLCIETVHGIGLRANLEVEYFENQTVINQNPCL